MTPEQTERLGINIGDYNRHHLRAQWTWTDSVEIAVSNGTSMMGHRLFPDECRHLAGWLIARAYDIEAGR